MFALDISVTKVTLVEPFIENTWCHDNHSIRC